MNMRCVSTDGLEFFSVDIFPVILDGKKTIENRHDFKQYKLQTDVQSKILNTFTLILFEFEFEFIFYNEEYITTSSTVLTIVL